jgi:Mn-containing catalase
MFYHDNNLQYQVRVDKPNPAFAKLLQQAIGGIEGEIRVCLQYLFQAWGNRGPNKYRDMLLDTGTEEISHIEMLCTAVALNLDGSTNELKDKIAGENPIVSNILGGMDPRHVISAGLAAMAVDSNGVPFNGSWVVGSGNIAADMYANVMAESTGRVLATRLYELTDDTGMKDMLSFLITRDAMHQNQWLAVLEDLGGVEANLPIPNTFPMDTHVKEFDYAFVSTHIDKQQTVPDARWASGPSIDGKGEFKYVQAVPGMVRPDLGMPDVKGYAQEQQMTGGMDKGILENIKDTLMP